MTYAQFIGPNPVETEAGIATILLQAGKMPGLLQINASSVGLSPESIQVEMNDVH